MKRWLFFILLLGGFVRKQLFEGRVIITTSDGDYTLTGQRITKGN